MRLATLLGLLLVLALLAGPLTAAPLGCAPCAGLRLTPEAAAGAPALLRSAHLAQGSPLFVAWEVSLVVKGDAGDSGQAAQLARAVDDAGGIPWIGLVFSTPDPLQRNLEQLGEELKAAADLAAGAPAGTYFQVLWRPAGAPGAPFSPSSYAFLLKRAAVALTGAQAQARVVTAPLPEDSATLTTFYAEEVAAYFEVVALAPPAGADGDTTLKNAVATLAKLDPGRPLVLDALPAPEELGDVLRDTARASAAGIDLTLFSTPALESRRLGPFIVLAREFAGDLSLDPGSAPEGAAEAWAFVRGKDLALRVIVVSPAAALAPGAAPLRLHFKDAELRRPTRFPFTSATVPPAVGQVAPSGLDLEVADPGREFVLGFERATRAETGGVAEHVDVSAKHEITVEEILRKLQAFEDAQNRRIDHYSAINTTHMRFQVTAGAESIEAAFAGPMFWTRQTGSDWAWQTLYVNGVKWRSKTLPEIPLIQPEKAAAMPLEIQLSRQYRYTLRGSEDVDGRPAYVVDFAPSGRAGERGKLYRGTVWIDHQLFCRLRSRAVQVGLSGEVSSNEETLLYTPVDEQGHAAPWTAPTFVMPLHLLAEQILSVLNEPTLVERETFLTDLAVNGAAFEEQRKTVESSDVTMVRDTPAGLRYLVKDQSGDRVVKSRLAESKLFAVAGLFYDDSLNYPLPLVGINYFSLDFRHTGDQLNLFFAGPLLTLDFADPRLGGSHSRFDGGASLFALAVPFTDNVYRNGKESVPEEVKMLPANFALKLGRTIGDFWKFNFSYGLLSSTYTRNSNTAHDFVLPRDNFLSSLGGGFSFAREGYTFTAGGSWSTRSRWSLWGLPGNTEFNPNQRSFERWNTAFAKNWYFSHFQKLSAEVDYVNGSHLDRFSSYQFGFFGETRIHGFKTDSVRAERAELSHVSYGIEIGSLFRIDGVFDAALGTDREAGMVNRFLAGTGVVGTVVGPWETVINLDVGVPVAGPTSGIVLYLVALKLFK